MSKNKPAKFKLTVDFQCGSCGALIHQAPGAPPEKAAAPKFCPRCGAGMERFCLACRKKADMFFEEWWPEDDECIRTYSPAKRCGSCGAILEPEKKTDEGDWSEA